MKQAESGEQRAKSKELKAENRERRVQGKGVNG
jgi:hypothetical protein